MPTPARWGGWATRPPFWADLPLYPLSPEGAPDVPVTLAVAGSRRSFLAAFQAIG
jgi:hypothetical protein